MNKNTTKELIKSFSIGQGALYPTYGSEKLDILATLDLPIKEEIFIALGALEVAKTPNNLPYYQEGFLGRRHKESATGSTSSHSLRLIRSPEEYLADQVALAASAHRIELLEAIQGESKLAQGLRALLISEEVAASFEERREIMREAAKKNAKFLEIGLSDIIESDGQFSGVVASIDGIAKKLADIGYAVAVTFVKLPTGQKISTPLILPLEDGRSKVFFAAAQQVDEKREEIQLVPASKAGK